MAETSTHNQNEAFARFRQMRDEAHQQFDAAVTAYNQNPTEELRQRKLDLHEGYISLSLLPFGEFEEGRDYVTEAINNRKKEEVELDEMMNSLKE